LIFILRRFCFFFLDFVLSDDIQGLND